MDYNTFKEKFFIAAARHGFDCWELYYAKSAQFSVRVRNGEIAEFKNANELGLSFRGIYRGKMGYAFTERIDDALIDVLLDKAAENALVINSDDEEELFGLKEPYARANSYNPALDGLTAGEKIQMALDMEKAALEADSRVKSADYCTVSTGAGEVRISNSYGLDLAHASNAFCAYLQPEVEENGVVKTWFDFWYGRDVSAFSPVKLAKDTVSSAVSYLPAKTMPSAAVPVLLSPLAAADLFAAFAGVFFAERAQKGFSLLKGKTGEAIASPAVTIHDDGICEKSVNDAVFDSEGVPCRNKVIVDKGVLKTLLYNLKSAKKDRTVSTGNGFKHSFRSPVETACTNFYLEPSGSSPEQLMSGIEYGVSVTELSGLHAGVDSISGDFSLSATGILIEGGRVTRPVEQIVVSGNFFDMLRNIVSVGGDLRFGMPQPAGCVGMPSILVSRLNVAGE